VALDGKKCVSWIHFMSKLLLKEKPKKELAFVFHLQFSYSVPLVVRMRAEELCLICQSGRVFAISCEAPLDLIRCGVELHWLQDPDIDELLELFHCGDFLENEVIMTG
jgi:hypothetical protein